MLLRRDKLLPEGSRDVAPEECRSLDLNLTTLRKQIKAVRSLWLTEWQKKPQIHHIYLFTGLGLINGLRCGLKLITG